MDKYEIMIASTLLKQQQFVFENERIFGKGFVPKSGYYVFMLDKFLPGPSEVGRSFDDIMQTAAAASDGLTTPHICIVPTLAHPQLYSNGYLVLPFPDVLSYKSIATS